MRGKCVCLWVTPFPSELYKYRSGRALRVHGINSGLHDLSFLWVMPSVSAGYLLQRCRRAKSSLICPNARKEHVMKSFCHFCSMNINLEFRLCMMVEIPCSLNWKTIYTISGWINGWWKKNWTRVFQGKAAVHIFGWCRLCTNKPMKSNAEDASLKKKKRRASSPEKQDGVAKRFFSSSGRNSRGVNWDLLHKTASLTFDLQMKRDSCWASNSKRLPTCSRRWQAPLLPRKRWCWTRVSQCFSGSRICSFRSSKSSIPTKLVRF